MAYDFDWSGLVDAPYSFPDSRLGIKRTTDRLYRGGCHTTQEMTEVLTLFKARKDSLYGTLRAIKDLSPDRIKEAQIEQYAAHGGRSNSEQPAVCAAG